jgi:hypothetical protein
MFSCETEDVTWAHAAFIVAILICFAVNDLSDHVSGVERTVLQVCNMLISVTVVTELFAKRHRSDSLGQHAARLLPMLLVIGMYLSLRGILPRPGWILFGLGSTIYFLRWFVPRREPDAVPKTKREGD